MAFWHKIFKKKKEDEERGEKQARESELKEEKEERPVASRTAIAGILRATHITEKTTNAAAQNQYIFKVAYDANKAEVKRAVEGRYGVNVISVNVLHMPGKERRRGRITGWKPGFKKAIVTLKEGQKIEI